MEGFGFGGAMFVPTAYVGGWNAFDLDVEPRESICDWHELQELAARGIVPESHGVSHHRLSDLAPAATLRELAESRSVLADGMGRQPQLFAYPYGDGGDVEVVPGQLEQVGYRAAFMYGGAPWEIAPDERYRIPRLAMGPDTDLKRLLDPAS